MQDVLAPCVSWDPAKPLTTHHTSVHEDVMVPCEVERSAAGLNQDVLAMSWQVTEDDLRRVAAATGAAVQTTVNGLDPKVLGQCARFEERQVQLTLCKIGLHTCNRVCVWIRHGLRRST